MTAQTLTCVDLFAGAGGMALGLERAGFEVVAVAEIDDAASRTYRRNILAGREDVWTRLGPEDGDVRDLDPGALQHALERRGISRVDLVAGGPPCQGFSQVGRGRLIHLDDRPGAHSRDARNTLVFDFCRVVEVLRPRAVLIENVTGMLNLEGDNHAERVCDTLEQLGYDVRLGVLNAAWYGVPQNRERLFILALAPDVISPSRWFPEPVHHGRSGLAAVGAQTLRHANFQDRSRVEYVWPDEGARAPVTVQEAFGDLPAFSKHLEEDSYSSLRSMHEPLEYGDSGVLSEYARLMRCWDGTRRSEHVHDHFCRYTPRDFPIFARMGPGDTYPRAVEIAASLYREAVECWDSAAGSPQPRPEDFIPPYPLETFAERWKKLDPDRPSWTVTAHLSRDCYSHIHPDDEQARTISIREAARLQSFPDAFIFEGNMGDCYRQIGNAVPPLLAHALGEALAAHLEREANPRPHRWARVELPVSFWGA